MRFLVTGVKGQLGHDVMDELALRIVQVAETEEDTDALVAAADAEMIYRKFNGLE